MAGLSDVGCRRANNEDCYAYWEPESEEEFQRKGRLAIVADGMGGQEGGQEASRIAVETIVEIYAKASDGDIRSQLLAAFRTAHQRIQQFAREHPLLQGMGTTCTAAVLVQRNLYFAHVGDSRLYLARGAKFSRLTRDDSFVQRLIDHGLATPEEAAFHPQKNVLTAALGTGAEIHPQFPAQPMELEAEDVLLLCTDGLWSMVNESEIHKIASVEKTDIACRELIQLARKRGGPDNITVQVLRFTSL